MESRGAHLTGVLDEAPGAPGRAEPPAAGSGTRAGQGVEAVSRLVPVVPLRECDERPPRRTVGCAHGCGPEPARARTLVPAQEAAPQESPARAGGSREGGWQTGSWRFTAPTTDASVPRLRHTVRELLERQPTHVPEDTLQGALLITSELVTNAVRHAALLSPEIAVEVALGGGWLRIAVEDSHPYRPKALAAEPYAEQTGGRGLLLVKALAGEAGGRCDVEQTGAGGKVIWAALPLTAVS